MVDLTDKYVGKEWVLDGKVLNPNYAFLINEINNYDIFVLQGGTRSGKTWAVTDYLHDLTLIHKGLQVNVVRQSRPVVEGTTLDTFKKSGNLRDDYDASLLNLTKLIYTKNANTIHFLGADDEEKARGRESHLSYFNEAPELPWEIYNQLSVRCTGKIIIDYNPSMPDSWVYSNILTRDKVALLKTTFKDNPHVTQKQLDDIEWARINDPDWYRVFGLGERGVIKGQIYTTWKKIEDDPKIWKDANIFIIDFGFSSDPCAVVQMKFDNRTMYARERLYEVGQDNIDLAIHLFFMGVTANSDVVADSAEPKSISELRNGWVLDKREVARKAAALGYEFKNEDEFERLCRQLAAGLVVTGAVKGKDSIHNGIQKVKQYEVLIPESSGNIWREYSKYKYKVDRFTGATLREPAKSADHLLDCIRYGASSHGRVF